MNARMMIMTIERVEKNNILRSAHMVVAAVASGGYSTMSG